MNPEAARNQQAEVGKGNFEFGNIPKFVDLVAMMKMTPTFFPSDHVSSQKHQIGNGVDGERLLPVN